MMIFNLGETWGEWFSRARHWHSWFAWHPICLEGSKFCWLQTIQRRRRYKHYYSEDEEYWEYKQ